MASSAAETLIGAVVLAAASGFLVYAAGSADIGGGGNGYEVIAKFRKADGLAVGGDVRMAGVKIGTVTDLSLDADTYFAVATLSVDDAVKLPEDSSAQIASEGLLGGAYIALEPGGAEYMLRPGDEITFTQGSVNLLDLFAKAIHGATAE